MTKVMPALSLWQPWATLVAKGVKYVETRSWPPHRDLIGQRLAIAATKTLTPDARAALGPKEPHAQALLDAVRAAGYHIARTGRRGGVETNLPLGQVLCTVRVAGSFPMVDAAPATREGKPKVAWDPPCLVIGKRQLLLVTDDGDIDVTDQAPFGDFRAGRVAWLFDDIREVVGIHPARGAQGVWNWRPEGIWEVRSTT